MGGAVMVVLTLKLGFGPFRRDFAALALALALLSSTDGQELVAANRTAALFMPSRNGPAFYTRAVAHKENRTQWLRPYL